MYTVSDIIMDIDRGILANNMIETCFSYRIIYFINENGKGAKNHVDTLYEGLRETMENIIKGNLSLTNSIVIAAVTVWKNGQSVSLLNKAYVFSLNGYFQQICGQKEKEYMNNNYGRRKVQWG